jgi:hypothetical protein
MEDPQVLFYFHDDKGEIIGNGGAPRSEAPQIVPDYTIVEYTGTAPDEMTQYLKDGEFADRPVMDITVSGSIISDIPDGTLVAVSPGDIAETVTDGSVDLSNSSDGTYGVQLTNFPYQPEYLEVTI